MENALRMKQLLKVIDYYYNEFIGGNENSMMDGNEYHAYTLDELVDDITEEIVNAKGYLNMEDSWEVVEAKHFRFLGKDEIHSIVLGRCFKRHNEEGKWEWEKVTA